MTPFSVSSYNLAMPESKRSFVVLPGLVRKTECAVAGARDTVFFNTEDGERFGWDYDGRVVWMADTGVA